MHPKKDVDSFNSINMEADSLKRRITPLNSNELCNYLKGVRDWVKTNVIILHMAAGGNLLLRAILDIPTAASTRSPWQTKWHAEVAGKGPEKRQEFQPRELGQRSGIHQSRARQTSHECFHGVVSVPKATNGS